MVAPVHEIFKYCRFFSFIFLTLPYFRKVFFIFKIPKVFDLFFMLICWFCFPFRTFNWHFVLRWSKTTKMNEISHMIWKLVCLKLSNCTWTCYWLCGFFNFPFEIECISKRSKWVNQCETLATLSRHTISTTLKLDKM